MYAVIILEEAYEDLRNIVAYISSENPRAAETLGRELLDEPQIATVSRLPSQKTARPLKNDPRAVPDLLPDPGTEKGCRNRSFQAWSTDQMTAVDSNQNQPSQASRSHWVTIAG